MIFYTLNLDEVQKTKFEYLYVKYRPLIFCLAYAMLEDELEAEDVVHDVFMKMLKYITEIESDDHAKTKAFVTTITRNGCIDMLRKRSKAQVVSWDELKDWQQPYEDAEQFFAMPEENRVLAIVENMPPLYKEIFLLKYVNELKDAAIADLLGIKEDSVRKRIYRGKKLLKKELIEVMNDAN